MTNSIPAARVARTWLGLTLPVRRLDYAAAGVTLMVLKYAVEMLLFWFFAGGILTPFDFLNPLLGTRQTLLAPAPVWLPWVLYAWTLPFLWVAVSMSIRRSVDAGGSPWLGFLILIPLVNLALIVALTALPSVNGDRWNLKSLPDDRRRDAVEPPWHAAVSVSLGVLLGGVMIAFSIYGMSSYGASLFVGTPLMMGATSAWFFNRRRSHAFGPSALIGAITVLCGFLGMFFFALEGVICLLMTVPLAMPAAAFGGLLGKAIADATRRSAVEVVAAVLVLPLWSWGEANLAQQPERVVLTAVEIDAPPEVVWENVIRFPELPAARPWYFRLGIACPERARITGEGVGAVRHCEFSTGTFIEPITHWDAPRRLAFDVISQPPPMQELSIYPEIHPPHLSGFLYSQRGEFRLVQLPSGGTRLEGRTWYRSATYPSWYWSAWYDLWIHKIHERVLEHIERLAEREPSVSGGSPA